MNTSDQKIEDLDYAEDINSYLIFGDSINSEIVSMAKQYRSDFKVDMTNEKRPFRHEILFVLPLMDEIKQYFNNEISVSYAIFKVVSRQGNIGRRVKSYYAENSLIRLISIWDYLFQVLSSYLDTEMLADYQIRDKMLLSRSVDIDFVKQGEGYKVVAKPYTPEIKKKVKKEIIKGNPVIKITDINRDNTLLKFIKKKFVKNERINQLFDLYKSDSVMKLKEIRHQVIHRRSIGSTFSIDSIDVFFHAQGIDAKHEGWIKIDELEELFDKNIIIVREAVQILNNIIRFDDYPNTKENGLKKFTAKNIWCDSCKKDLLIAEGFYKFLVGSNFLIYCPRCLTTKVEIKEDKEVNEPFYFSNFSGMIKIFNENIDLIISHTK